MSLVKPSTLDPRDLRRANEPVHADLGGRRVTFVSAAMPRFDVASGQNRVWRLLELLVRFGARVSYVSWTPVPDRERYTAMLPGVSFCLASSPLDAVRRAAATMPDVLWGTSVWTPDLLRTVARIGVEVRKRAGSAFVLDTMDSHTKKYRRKFEYSACAADQRRADVFLAAERVCYPVADCVVVVSEAERQALRETTPGAYPIAVVPTLHRLAEHVTPFADREHLAFVGNFAGDHNRDAVESFVRQTLPHICAVRPHVRLHLIGRDADLTAIDDQHRDLVEAIGYVPDIDEVLANYRVFVCPLTYGAGLKGKLAAAAAAGLPVVTTSVGAEGFPLESGVNCLIADTPEAFADAVERVYSDRLLWERLSENGRVMIADTGSLAHVSAQLWTMLEPLTARPVAQVRTEWDRPVFVIGSRASGADLMQWGLAQHSAFVAVLDTRWLGAIARDLSRTYARRTGHPAADHLTASRVTEDDFLAAFGRAIGELLLGGTSPLEGAGAAALPSPSRFVDASAGAVLHVAAMRALFPRARFIHMVRDVHAVVPAVRRSSPADLSQEQACADWLRDVRAGIDAERALGSSIVLHVRYEDLIDGTEAAMRRCLEFLDEPYDAACLRPFNGLTVSEVERAGLLKWDVQHAEQSAIIDEAEILNHLIRREARGDYPPDAARAAHLKRTAFERRAAAAPPPPEGNADTEVARIRRLVRDVVPAGATVLVVSRGDPELLRLDRCRSWHFPQQADGAWAGYHPADSGEAIAHLEALRARGATHLAFPSTAFWWMDHYREFRSHLISRYPLVAFGENSCAIFSLGPPPPPADSWTSSGLERTAST